VLAKPFPLQPSACSLNSDVARCRAFRTTYDLGSLIGVDQQSLRPTWFSFLVRRHLWLTIQNRSSPNPEGYTATDILARYKRMRGFNVLHPMGWDSYGLPAERYAMRSGIHPAITTASNIATFRKQVRRLGKGRCSGSRAVAG